MVVVSRSLFSVVEAHFPHAVGAAAGGRPGVFLEDRLDVEALRTGGVDYGRHVDGGEAHDDPRLVEVALVTGHHRNRELRDPHVEAVFYGPQPIAGPLTALESERVADVHDGR